MSRRRFTTTDSVELSARRWLTDGEPHAAVVLVHGFTASSEDPKVVAVGDALHALGLDVVAYDARGHGSSGGACTLGDLERHDVAAAVAVARERTDRIVLVGASMGAIAVLRHAADDPSVAGVVTVSCPARWSLPRSPHGVLAALLTRTWTGRAVVARWMRVTVAPRWTSAEPPVELAARVSVPLVIVHGDRDRFIASTAARELYDAACEPKQLVLVPELGHAYEDAAVGAIVDAVGSVLAPVGTPQSR